MPATLTFRSRCACAIVCIPIGLIHLGVARAGTPLRVMTAAMDVRDLSAAEAKKEYPVRIRGVITYVNALSDELFVQDASAGIFVFIRYSRSSSPLTSGQLVQVDGVTAPGDFSSSITKAAIKVLGYGPMPAPLRMPFDHLLTGEEDCQWGELKGVVRSGRESQGVLYLNVATTGGAFLVIMKDHPADWSTSLIDAKVTLAGVLAAAFNEHRQVVGVRMFVPAPHFIHIDDPAPPSPFDLPQTQAVDVGAFRMDRDWSRRIRVRAAVTAVVSNSLVYVSQGEGNLPAEMEVPCSAKPGDLLDLVGFPGSIDGRPGLKNAVYRVIGRDRDLKPLRIAARDVLPPEADAVGSGLSIAAGTRHDLKLLTVDGTLVQLVRGLHSQTMTVSSLDQDFGVTIPDSIQGAADGLKLGSQLKLTGVCLITYDEYRRARSFRILIRRTTDIVVESRPPWWTLQHALWIMGAMLASVFAALAWIGVLRKHVATKTRELQEVNERLHLISVEDALTGAANRRRFDEMLKIEVSRASRTTTSVSLIMVDIDHFKAVNDFYGHQIGDDCLIKVVQALRNAVSRCTDIIARYGGEEFAVILPNTGGEPAAALAELMRGVIEPRPPACSRRAGGKWPWSVRRPTGRLASPQDRCAEDCLSPACIPASAPALSPLGHYRSLSSRILRVLSGPMCRGLRIALPVPDLPRRSRSRWCTTNSNRSPVSAGSLLDPDG
jgi:diguanylate cyclase (GGDEF)-like protein